MRQADDTTARVTIHDKQADPTWVECVIEDVWDQVKIVRKKSGPRQRVMLLTFGATEVAITVRRVKP